MYVVVRMPCSSRFHCQYEHKRAIVVESKTKQRHDVTTLTPSVCILSPAGQLEPGDRERATQTQRRLEADRGNGRNSRRHFL